MVVLVCTCCGSESSEVAVHVNIDAEINEPEPEFADEQDIGRGSVLESWSVCILTAM